MHATFRKSLHWAVLTTGMSCAFASAFASEWADVGPSIDGDAKIQMSKKFSNKTGKFNATPESMLDKREFIEGNFIVGTYRYVYNTAEQEDGRSVDEMVSTEIMDCPNKYYGTLKQTKKYKGKIVSEKVTAEGQVRMTQMNGSNIDSQLCDLHAGQKPAPLDKRAVNNPDYKPKMTAEQMDALVDKYAPPGAKK